MSKVRLYGSTSGYIELQAPAVAPDSTLTLPALAGGFGKVGQIVQTVKTDAFTTTSTSPALITGMEAVITPTSATSKILLIATGTAGNNNSNNIIRLRFYRGATAIGLSTGASTTNDTMLMYPNNSNVTAPFAMSLLDSPTTTSATTYGLYLAVNGGTGSVGRLPANTNHGAITTLTAIEVAA